MNTLDISHDLHLNPVRVGATKGGEYASPCPMCGGRDRFHVWPEDGEHGSWWCRRCGRGGDAIQLLREARGMGYRDACEYLGVKAAANTRGRTPRAPKTEAPDFVPREINEPEELWRAKASAFADYAHKELLKNTEQLAWLAARGITSDTAARFSLGWNPKPLWRKRAGWGLPDKTVADKDGRTKALTLLALPAGLVMPYFLDGRIHRLRIRRPEPDVEDRYRVIPGSGMAPMAISPADPQGKGKSAWAVVESELDALLIAQDAGDIVGVCALGSVSTRPDAGITKELKNAASILVALDADEAGAKEWGWWQARYPQADRWPVPSGKDPGDYRKSGGDIRAWILAGLPYGLRPAAAPPAADSLTKEAAPAAPLDATGPAPAQNEEAAPDNPIRTIKRTCPDCGAVEVINVYSEHKDYRRPKCYRCFWTPTKKKGA